MRNLYRLVLLIFFLSMFYPFTAIYAAGATLYLSPSTGSYEVGQTFTVEARINSGGGAGINASEGSIKFDSSLLSVVSVSKTGSIFSLWTKEPVSSGGSVVYGGGSPSAYTGSSGLIISVKFKANKTGDATIAFSSGEAIEAGPPFSNVVSQLGSAKFSIVDPKPIEKPVEKPVVKPVEKPVEKPTETKAKGILPPLPEIESVTHPDENIWYAINEPEFSWKVLADLTGVSFSVSKEAESDPGPTSDGIIETNKFEAIEDGTHYFHIKYQNANGWSQIAHRKFLVDVTSPEKFTLLVENDGDETNPSPIVRFDTKDVSSGIEYYDIKVDNVTEKVSPESVKDGYYQLPILDPGKHDVLVTAFDRAANLSSSTVSFIITPLKTPIITSIPKQINKKEELIIQGTSFYPQVTIKLSITKAGEDPKEYSVKTDDEGNWSYFHNGMLEKGTYEISAKIIDDRGAQSLSSTNKLLIVVSPSIVDTYGLIIILILLLIIFGLVSFILYQSRRFEAEKKRIKIETEEVKIKLRKIFAALREEVDELIQLADKRPGLSEAERRVKEKLQESLDISEEFISKEIEDVEKEITMKKKKIKK